MIFFGGRFSTLT